MISAKHVLLAAAAILMPSWLPAEAAYPSLLEDSPFISLEYKQRQAQRARQPAKATPPPPPRAPNTLAQEISLRAIIGSGDNAYFTFHDTKTEGLNKTHFLKVGEEAERFQVVSYDVDAESVVIRSGGQQATIRLSDPTFGPVSAPHRGPDPNRSDRYMATTPTPQATSQQRRPVRRLVTPVRTTTQRANNSNNNSSSGGGRGQTQSSEQVQSKSTGDSSGNSRPPITRRRFITPSPPQ
jgi:hypothetical protein